MQMAGSSKQQILQRLPPWSKNAFMLHYTTCHETKATYGHAICIKKHQGRWYKLDSESTPQWLDDPQNEGWETLYGHI